MAKRHACPTRQARRARTARQSHIARTLRQQAYTLDPANVLDDVVWKYSSRNGNPLPEGPCGGFHTGACCEDCWCCRASYRRSEPGESAV